MDMRTVVPPSLAGPLQLTPFAATLMQPVLVGDPASARLFARPWKGVEARIEQWDRRRRLMQDSDPALYLHEYSDGVTTVRGLVGLLELTTRAVDASVAAVVPHEEIHPRQSDELVDRMAQMALQPAPILLVHRGSAALKSLLAAVVLEAPTRQYADHAGHPHRIWALRDPDLLTSVSEAMASSRAMIADGHHRYAAYLRMQARIPGGAYDRGLAFLVDQDVTPLAVGAIHRVLPRVTLADIQAAARSIGAPFQFRPHELRPDAKRQRVVVTDGRRWATLDLTPTNGRALVEALHERLIPALPRGPWDIEFHHEHDAALDALRHRSAVALLLPPPAFDDISTAAFSGRTLPEKATSFQPKPAVGSLMRIIR
ncbi:DUF1015 family protein [Nocardioides sp.]|uniref:DUF1015 family protein n=1 Tax=Nocardioides sp. TaxID=35761 RepID=UPI002624B616|nr:DUF1015 family protein [Nocardioides sp.]